MGDNHKFNYNFLNKKDTLLYLNSNKAKKVANGSGTMNINNLTDFGSKIDSNGLFAVNEELKSFTKDSPSYYLMSNSLIFSKMIIDVGFAVNNTNSTFIGGMKYALKHIGMRYPSCFTVDLNKPYAQVDYIFERIDGSLSEISKYATLSVLLSLSSPGKSLLCGQNTDICTTYKAYEEMYQEFGKLSSDVHLKHLLPSYGSSNYFITYLKDDPSNIYCVFEQPVFVPDILIDKIKSIANSGASASQYSYLSSEIDTKNYNLYHKTATKTITVMSTDLCVNFLEDKGYSISEPNEEDNEDEDDEENENFKNKKKNKKKDGWFKRMWKNHKKKIIFAIIAIIIGIGAGIAYYFYKKNKTEMAATAADTTITDAKNHSENINDSMTAHAHGLPAPTPPSAPASTVSAPAPASTVSAPTPPTPPSAPASEQNQASTNHIAEVLKTLPETILNPPTIGGKNSKKTLKLGLDAVDKMFISS